MNISEKYEELPFKSEADVFVDLNIEFPNSDKGFDIKELSFDSMKDITSKSSTITNAIIKAFSDEFLISDPMFVLIPYNKHCKVSIKIAMRRKN